jgi:hypothetical protein
MRKEKGVVQVVLGLRSKSFWLQQLVFEPAKVEVFASLFSVFGIWE